MWGIDRFACYQNLASYHIMRKKEVSHFDSKPKVTDVPSTTKASSAFPRKSLMTLFTHNRVVYSFSVNNSLWRTWRTNCNLGKQVNMVQSHVWEKVLWVADTRGRWVIRSSQVLLLCLSLVCKSRSLAKTPDIPDKSVDLLKKSSRHSNVMNKVLHSFWEICLRNRMEFEE